MHYNTIIGYILATSCLAMAKFDSDSDSDSDSTPNRRWGLEFFTDGGCGKGHSSFGDSKTWECINIDPGSDAKISSFGWDADDCDFDLDVFFEEDCKGFSDKSWGRCKDANSFKGQSYKSFVVSFSLLDMEA
jgi:hypothetical protein